MSLSEDYKSIPYLYDALSLYEDDVLLWREHFNLTAAETREQFETFHIKDSLLPFEIIKGFIDGKCKNLNANATLKFADLGTGAGLPLLPLSIAFSVYSYPQEFYGIDRNLKRCTFLKNTINNLKYNGFIKNNIKIINNDITFIKDKFDFITFRAFTDIREVEKNIHSIIKEDGTIFAYKGKVKNAECELASLNYFRGKVEKLPPLENRERSIMILKPF